MNCDEILRHIDNIDDVCAKLRSHALGFDMCLDDFIENVSDEELNMNEIINFSVELAKSGYAMSPYYSPQDEKVFRYFTIISLMITYITFPTEARTFTTLSYLCELFDLNYDEFEQICDSIKSDVFQYYWEKFQDITEFLLSDLKNTFEVLMIYMINKYTPCDIVAEIGNTIVSDIEHYVDNNSYDVLLNETLK